MTSLKSVMLLLVIIGMLSAFNVNDYLYPSESNASVTYTNFSFGGDSYSLVSISGASTFLLKDGEPMTGPSDISNVLHEYYLQKYYPSADQLANLQALIQQFNISRNSGYDFPGKGEYVCRNDILLADGKINVSGQPVRCVDNASCTQNAELLFSIYGDGLNLPSSDAILAPLEDFALSSFYMDGLLSNYTTQLNNVNESTLPGTISYITSTVDSLQAASYKVENNVFRTPRLNDSVDLQACQGVCWAICPSMQLNHGAIAELKGNASIIAQEIGPISGYATLSASLSNNTAARFDYIKVQNTTMYYQDTFAPINQSGQAAIALGNEALSHVQNDTLTKNVDQMQSLSISIPQNIAAHNFTTIDSDISNYQQLTSVITSSSIGMLAAYNASRDAKNMENSLVLILQTKDLDPVSMKSLQSLQNQTDDLNAQFRDGMTVDQLEGLGSNYTSLSISAQNLLDTQSNSPATRVLLLFRSFGRKINSGIDNFVISTKLMSPSDIISSPYPLGLFSALVFLSLGSIVFLVFMHIFSSSRFSVPQTGHILGAALLALLIVILVFSVFLFLILGKTSTDATLPEFLSDFSTKNSTAIVVDLRNVTFSDSNSMQSCASSLANSISGMNKTWSIYTLTPNSCVESAEGGGNYSLSSSDCASNISAADSSFVLGYSPLNTPPKLFITYQNKAQIMANSNYYQTCPLVALFS